MQNKGLSIIIAAAIAYGYYKFSQMTPEQKQAIKEKGKKFIDENFGLGNIFSRKTTEVAGQLPE